MNHQSLHAHRLMEQVRKEDCALFETVVTSYFQNIGLQTQYDFPNQTVTVFLGQKEEKSRAEIAKLIQQLRDAGYGISDAKDTTVDGAKAVKISLTDEPVSTGQDDVTPENMDDFDLANGVSRKRLPGMGPEDRKQEAATVLQAYALIEFDTLGPKAKGLFDDLKKQANAALDADDIEEADELLDRMQDILDNPKKYEANGGAPLNTQNPVGSTPPQLNGEADQTSNWVSWSQGGRDRVGTLASKISGNLAQVSYTTESGETKTIGLRVDQLVHVETGLTLVEALKRQKKFRLLYSN
jgi:flagellin-specific chaperone FliS